MKTNITNKKLFYLCIRVHLLLNVFFYLTFFYFLFVLNILLSVPLKMTCFS